MRIRLSLQEAEMDKGYISLYSGGANMPGREGSIEKYVFGK